MKKNIPVGYKQSISNDQCRLRQLKKIFHKEIHQKVMEEINFIFFKSILSLLSVLLAFSIRFELAHDDVIMPVVRSTR